MSGQHTQGRLTLGKWASASGGPELQYTNGSAKQQVFNCQPMESASSAENARRLVACWNAFDASTMTTESIEALVVIGGVDALADGAVVVTRELDAARALLADAMDTFDEMPDEDHEIADRIRAFLDVAALPAEAPP